MTAPAFVHLRLHSEFSIVDGTVRIDDAIAAAVADAMPALAITDLANAFGLVKFYKAARRAGVKPIFGCDVWLTHDAERDQPYRVLLLAQSRDGYLRLADWLTRAYRTNQYRGRVEFRREWFREGTAGIIALSGARDGDAGKALLQGNAAGAAKVAREWAQAFPDRYYLEVQRAGHADDDALVAATVRLAGELALPLVATHPVQFLRPGDFRAHEARVCISEGHVLADPRRPRRFTHDQYFKTQAEMTAAFADLPDALANTIAIAQRCSLTIPLGKNYLPDFPTPPGVTLDEYLHREAAAGLLRQLASLFPDPDVRERRRPEYAARLDFEVKTIVQMGFSGYFLIVADFINWAKANGVPVGPGRGSGAGSLVAYSLGITGLDPLRYALLFERFLNPERVSMPDFDIDFCQTGRDRVIEYVKNKYGADSVSQIATFGTMAAKAVVRDVGRVLDLPYMFCDGIAKLIPFQPGKLITLKDARTMEPLLAERERNEEEVRELLSLAGALEGLTRNVGMHAGGVLIAPGKLTDFCPLYAQAGSEGLLSQFDKDDVEAIGLVKFDFLGLTTLTILDWTLKYVRQLDPASTLTLEALPLDDKPTYDIFRAGNTTAVFQFESRGMRDLLKQAPPTRFEDIVALVALYRPGPMELIPDYVARRTGRERAEYSDPRLEPILSPTYGVMVYQEQVMQIAQSIGGYTLGGADLLRRAMGKKNAEEMARHRDIFVEGAQKNNVPKARATHLYDLMEKFAGYGFNKSHAAAYALIAYQTAYFKAHHPAAFAAANLSLVMDDTDKVRQFFDDAIASGLKVVPPDVNASNYRFEPIDTEAAALRPRRDQGHRRAGDRVDRRRAQDGRPVPRSLRFLPPRRQAARQPPRRRGADPRRRVRCDRPAPRDAVQLGRRRAGRGRACRCDEVAGLAVRRRGRRSAHARRGARLDRGRAPREREARAGLLPVRPSVPQLSRRSWRRSCARRSRTSRRPASPCGSPASSRRCACSRAGAARWRSSRSTTAKARPRSSCTTRRSTPHAPCCARTSSSSSRRRSSSASPTTARCRGCASSPRRCATSPTLRKRHAKGLRIACNGAANAGPPVRAALAVPERHLPDRRRIPQSRPRRRDRAAGSVARQSRTTS